MLSLSRRCDIRILPAFAQCRRCRLLTSPMVRDETDRAEIVETSQHCIHVAIIAVSFRLTRRVFMLDVVCQRQIHKERLFYDAACPLR
jgi:hypothetical protein